MAILFVIVHHFGFHLPRWIDWGPIAPNIFFLLSGYLITLSLLKMQKSPQPGQVLKFHVARLVRLLPALYAMLAVGWLVGLSEFREGLLWHASFLTSIQMVVQNDWVGSASPLWSLSIQEQFYLLWPLLLLLPARWLLPALLTTVVGATAFRVTCLYMGSTDFFRWFLLPGSLDTFAAGGIIAGVSQARKGGVIVPQRWRWAFLVLIMGAWWLARTIRKDYASAQINLAFIDTMETLVFGGLLIEFLQYRGSVISRLFSLQPLCFLGRISYGLYLWHLLVALALAPLLDGWGVGIDSHPFLRAGALIGVCTLAAWLSWTFLEKPFIGLGRRLINAEWNLPRKLNSACPSQASLRLLFSGAAIMVSVGVMFVVFRQEPAGDGGPLMQDVAESQEDQAWIHYPSPLRDERANSDIRALNGGAAVRF